MAVDSPILYKGVWVYLRDSMGPSYGGANDRQKNNAEKFYNLLRVFGYSHAAACGVLGNMQTESGLSPGALSGQTSALPNDGEHLADLTNNVILNWTGTGAHPIGLIQWNGTTSQDPPGSQIGSFAIRYDLEWYDWELQIFRLEMEWIYDPTGWGGVNGTTYNFWYPSGGGSASITWANYKTFSGTAAQAAEYFLDYRERTDPDAAGRQHRKDNATYWESYFSGYSVTTSVSHIVNACMAYLFRDSRYPYSQYDCIHYVNLVRRRLGLPQMTNGTNSLWRNVGGNFLWWRGTLQECLDLYGEVPDGAYLFKCYPEGTPGYNTIPEQYRGDGVGNFDHIGIYTGRGLGVMQSGGYDVTPPSGFNGVHDTRTRLDESPPWWTHVAFGNNITFDEEPGPVINLPLWLLFEFRKRRLIKNVRRTV